MSRGEELTENDMDDLTAAAAAAVVAAAAAANEVPPPPAQGTNNNEQPRSSKAATGAAIANNNDEEEEDEEEGDDPYNKWSQNAYGEPVAKTSGKFSKEESELVRKSVEDFCAAKQISTARLCSECDHKAELKGAWMEIAKRIPHRSVQSVYRHGIRRLHPFKRGAWSEAECAMLVELVARLGKKWSTIQGKLNRSADSCRDKYREMSDDYIKGRWKEAETLLLMRHIREATGASAGMDMQAVAKMVEEQNILIPWSNISKRMGKRSRLSCFKKWQKMTAPGMENFRVSEEETKEGALKRKLAEGVAGNSKRAKTEDGEFDDVYSSAKMADETVEAVGLPDARSSFV